jgi:V8-like Glu-specific endopeptidase
MPQVITNLLGECTVRIKIKSHQTQHDGSGFFVAPNLILTCAHVVSRLSEGDLIEDIYSIKTGDSYKAKVKYKATDKSIDLAILEIVGEMPNHPCVYLGSSELIVNCDLYTFGYPRNSPEGDTVTFKYDGPHYKRSTTDSKKFLWHKVSGGHVEKGLSGSPVLHLLTGLVCGVVAIYHDNNEKSYVRAVSTDSVFYTFPELEDLRASFHIKDNRWSKLIPSPQTMGQIEDLAENPDYCKFYILDVLKNPETNQDARLVRQLYEKYNLPFTHALESLLDKSKMPPSLYQKRQELVIQAVLTVGHYEDLTSIIYSILDDIDSLVETRLKAKYAINNLKKTDLGKAVKDWAKQIDHPIRFPTDQDVNPLIERVRGFERFLPNEKIADLLSNQKSIEAMSSFLLNCEEKPILENCFYLFLSVENENFYELVRNSYLKENFSEYLKTACGFGE